MNTNCALFVAALIAGLADPLVCQTNPATISIIPRPAQLTTRSGSFTLTPRTTIWATRGTAALGKDLARYLEPATGFDLSVRTSGTPAGNRIVLRLDETLARLGDEGYILDVSPRLVSIRAPKAAGVFYGIQ